MEGVGYPLKALVRLCDAVVPDLGSSSKGQC